MNIKALMILYTIITFVYAVIVFGFSLKREFTHEALAVFAVWVIVFLVVNGFVSF